MEFTSLPGTTFRASRLGFGCGPLGGHGWGPVNEGEVISAIHRALDLGINFFDTADVYGLGHSEEVLARALGPLRNQVVIATKGGVVVEAGKSHHDNRPRYIAQALEASLRRLKLERIPLYYLHWPDRRTPIDDAVGALEDLKRQGKVGAIGISNFNADELSTATDRRSVAAFQCILNLVERDAEQTTLQVCHKRGIPFVSACSLAQGLLTGKYGTDCRFDPTDRRSGDRKFHSPDLEHNLGIVDRLKTLARRLGRSPAEVALRWLLDGARVSCALTGIKTVSEIEDNAGAIGWTLDAESLRYLANGAG